MIISTWKYSERPGRAGDFLIVPLKMYIGGRQGLAVENVGGSAVVWHGITLNLDSGKENGE